MQQCASVLNHGCSCGMRLGPNVVWEPDTLAPTHMYICTVTEIVNNITYQHSLQDGLVSSFIVPWEDVRRG